MSTDYISKAHSIVTQVPQILENRGLEPLITEAFITTSHKGHTWLFILLDEKRINRIERYIAPDLVHQITTALGGLPVLISNTTGLRYAILLSPAPKLEHCILYDGYQAGLVQIGDSYKGLVSVTWPALGHVLAAGMTRSGKSNFLRLVTLQALQAGHQVILVDPDGQTYPEGIEGHPGTLHYSAGLDFTQPLDLAHEIYTQRQADKATMDNRPDQPRVMLVIDEYNGLALSNGGAKGVLAQGINSLAFGALKFGIHLVLAGHEFTRDLVGPVSGQMASRLCFAVRAPSTSRVVVGRVGAESIRVAGRALTDPWGWVQCYAMGAQDMAAILGSDLGPAGLSAQDKKILDLAQATGGRLTFDILRLAGLSRSQAERTRQDWIARGLAKYDPAQFNSLVITYSGPAESIPTSPTSPTYLQTGAQIA